MQNCELAFYADGGKSHDEFQKDPLRVLRYLIEMETEEDGLATTQIVYDQYLSNNEANPVDQLEKVFFLCFFIDD